MKDIIVTDIEIDKLYHKLNKDSEAAGYHLNPDMSFTRELLHGLLVNEKRYDYQSCPCRIADGDKTKDLDIICPCDYRDPDLVDFGSCYCALYVSADILTGRKKVSSIPERRPPAELREQKNLSSNDKKISSLSLPVWRCKVCGYLCARDNPPEICPICKATKERFEQFI